MIAKKIKILEDRLPEREYFALHDDGLRNGSFIRKSRFGLTHWVNGDCMGHIMEMPSGVKPVDLKHAERLIPNCCV